MNRVPLIGISRLRMGTDGHGVTTLVAFHGCPLYCRYCLNPQCHYDLKYHHDPQNINVMVKHPYEVWKELQKDELYFMATKGGVTFGGGEPLMQSAFIKRVLDYGAKAWNVSVETSLNVPRENLELLLPFIDEYIVDIKDMNPDIYLDYTLSFNDLVKSNLQWLIEQGKAEHIICRIPLIPNFNTPEDQQRSKKDLEDMGLTRFDLFTYNTKIKK